MLFCYSCAGSCAVSPSLTQFGEIGSAYPEFTIIVAIGLRNLMLNRNHVPILYLYDVY